MGKRGPAGKPTQLRILHGDRKDRINHDEPSPPEQAVTCPEFLSDAAKQIWERLAPGLAARRVLTPWDADAFAVLYESLATALVNGSALLVQGATGLVRNPALMVQAEAERAFLTYGARFGLTPSDRQALKTEVAGDGKATGAERLLS